MAEAAQARVQTAIQGLLKDLDQSCLRKMQADMHLCAAKCCQDQKASMEQVHDCVTKCSQQMSATQKFVEKEMNNYQGRLERCAYACQDGMRDKIGANTTDSEMKEFSSSFEKCLMKCADTHVELIPNMFKRMREIIQKGNVSKELA